MTNGRYMGANDRQKFWPNYLLPMPGSALQSGVVGINNRADAIIGLVSAIKGDTGTISSDGAGILTQAHGISCDRILGLVGPVSATCQPFGEAGGAADGVADGVARSPPQRLETHGL